SMQISAQSLNFAEKDISIRIFSELHKRLRMFNAKDADYIKMGSFNKYNISTKRMYSQLVGERTMKVHQLLRHTFNNLIQLVDKYVHYDVLESTENKFILESTPGELFKNAFSANENDYGYEVGLYRLGHIKTYPCYFGHRELQNEQLHFEPRDGTCTYSYDII